MSRLRVVPIVEGHGEYEAVRVLLQRVWTELLGGEYLHVLRPIRQHRDKLIKPEELEKAVKLAALKLAEPSLVPDPWLILVIIDAEKDCPAELGPKLLAIAQHARSDLDISCVLANVEYETWFVAAAGSLSDYLNLAETEAAPELPEGARAGKSWVGRHFKGIKYSETVDQPAMTARMDLALCRRRSPSFDKLCRELERRVVRRQ